MINTKLIQPTSNITIPPFFPIHNFLLCSRFFCSKDCSVASNDFLQINAKIRPLSFINTQFTISNSKHCLHHVECQLIISSSMTTVRRSWYMMRFSSMVVKVCDSYITRVVVYLSFTAINTSSPRTDCLCLRYHVKYSSLCATIFQ